jgi:hypothetical protein
MYAKNMCEDDALEWLETTLTEGVKAKPAPGEKRAPAAKKPVAVAKTPASATKKTTTVAKKSATVARKPAATR